MLVNLSGLAGQLATLHDGDFLGGEVVELVDKLVDLLVGGADLALQEGALLRQPCAC